MSDPTLPTPLTKDGSELAVLGIFEHSDEEGAFHRPIAHEDER